MKKIEQKSKDKNPKKTKKDYKAKEAIKPKNRRDNKNKKTKKKKGRVILLFHSSFFCLLLFALSFSRIGCLF